MALTKGEIDEIEMVFANDLERSRSIAKEMNAKYPEAIQASYNQSLDFIERRRKEIVEQLRREAGIN